MEEFFSSDKTHLADAESTHKRIRYARILTDRILADDYHDMIFRSHYERWGRPVYGSEKHDIGCVMTINYPNANTDEEKERQRREHLALSRHVESMKQQDIDSLFGTLKKYIQCWWD